MGENYLLIEDDCVSNTRETFKKDLKEITGLSLNDFKSKSTMTSYDSNDTVKYIYDGYLLERFAVSPHYHLSKIGDNTRRNELEQVAMETDETQEIS